MSVVSVIELVSSPTLVTGKQFGLASPFVLHGFWPSVPYVVLA